MSKSPNIWRIWSRWDHARSAHAQRASKMRPSPSHGRAPKIVFGTVVVWMTVYFSNFNRLCHFQSTANLTMGAKWKDFFSSRDYLRLSRSKGAQLFYDILLFSSHTQIDLDFALNVWHELGAFCNGVTRSKSRGSPWTKVAWISHSTWDDI